MLRNFRFYPKLYEKPLKGLQTGEWLKDMSYKSGEEAGKEKGICSQTILQYPGQEMNIVLWQYCKKHDSGDNENKMDLNYSGTWGNRIFDTVRDEEDRE